MITIARLTAADRADWERLFRGYVAFYEQDHPQPMYDRAWSEFQAEDRMHALGAWLDGSLAGIVHFLTHARTTAADACYLRRTLEDLHLPRYVYDRDAMLAVLRRFRDWQAAGARIFFGHDAEFWATVPQAPVALQ